MITNDVVRIGNEWHFDDGTILPVVSGGSDAGAAIVDSGGSGGNSTTDTGSVVVPNEPSGTEEPTLGNQFLSNIPEADRPIVAKYISDWDKGVNERFQKIHSEYEPYKQLGDVDSLSEALKIRQLLDENPEYVYSILQAELGQGQPNQQQQQQQQEIPAEYEGLPEQFVKEHLELKRMLESTAQLLLDTRQRDQQAEEDAQLDALMKDLKAKHGEFDDRFVLTQLHHGASPEDAVKAWNELKQSIINETTKKPPQPPSLTGGGPLPHYGKNVEDLSKSETKELVAKMLAARQQ